MYSRGRSVKTPRRHVRPTSVDFSATPVRGLRYRADWHRLPPEARASLRGKLARQNSAWPGIFAAVTARKKA
jgi:hypothetical protein